MLKRILKANSFGIRLRPTLNPSGYVRYNSQNFHRHDEAGSADAADAADAAATIMADQLDTLKQPNKATWIDALERRKALQKEGKVPDSFSYTDPLTTEVGEKTRNGSFSFLTLPFKEDKWLCDSYINAFGRLRAGQLFQDLDALAGRIAYRHCSPAEPVNVTASVDRIYMVKKVDEISKYNFVLAGAVSWTGRSSMEITVKGYAFTGALPENITESTLPDENVFLNANFTFVARNPQTHKSFAVNRLIPLLEKEWLDYTRAESHNAKKKFAAKDSTIRPTDEENRLINDMWKLTQAVSDRLPQGMSFMKDTKILSTMFMQPQYRNRHSYMIFGGYLLRQLFELAYCAAAAFAHAGPRFVSLDSTTFKAPVPVGSVLSMEASVAYTEHLKDSADEGLDAVTPFDFQLPATNKIIQHLDAFLSEPGTLVQVKVNTTIKELDLPAPRKSGTFIYSFFVPKLSYTEGQPSFCSVIPQTYSEMMEYIEGRRRAQDTAHFIASFSKN